MRVQFWVWEPDGVERRDRQFLVLFVRGPGESDYYLYRGWSLRAEVDIDGVEDFPDWLWETG